MSPAAEKTHVGSVNMSPVAAHTIVGFVWLPEYYLLLSLLPPATHCRMCIADWLWLMLGQPHFQLVVPSRPPLVLSTSRPRVANTTFCTLQPHLHFIFEVLWPLDSPLHSCRGG